MGRKIVKEKDDNVIVDQTVNDFSVDSNIEKSNDVNEEKIKKDNKNKDNIEVKELDLGKELAEQRLKEALETETPKKKRKSLISTLIFLAINIVVMVFVIRACIGETKDHSFSELFVSQGNKLWWLLLGVGLLLLSIFADTMIFFSLIKQSTKKRNFKTSLKVTVVGKYYDYITPFSFGGQPSQILNLTRAGMSPGVATSIPIIKLIVYNTVYALTIWAFFIFGMPYVNAIAPAGFSFFLIFFKLFAYFGLICTALVCLTFILVGNGKIIGRSLARWVVKLGYSLHIVKDYRKSYNNFMKQVVEYQSSMRYLRQNKKTLIICVFWSLVGCLSTFSIPVAVVLAIAPINAVASFSTPLIFIVVAITMFLICQMASIVIPLPGGTGMMEVSFMTLFGTSFLLSSNIAWGLLLWRILSYYIPIIIGFTVSTVSSIIRASNTKKEIDSEKNIQES